MIYCDNIDVSERIDVKEAIQKSAIYVTNGIF